MLSDIPAYELALSVAADICARLNFPQTVRTSGQHYARAGNNADAIKSVSYQMRATTAVWSVCEAAIVGILDKDVPVLCFDPTRDYTHVNYDTYLLHEKIAAALAGDRLARQLLNKRCAKLNLNFDRLLWGHVLEIPCGDLGRQRDYNKNGQITLSLS